MLQKYLYKELDRTQGHNHKIEVPPTKQGTLVISCFLNCSTRLWLYAKNDGIDDNLEQTRSEENETVVPKEYLFDTI